MSTYNPRDSLAVDRRRHGNVTVDIHPKLGKIYVYRHGANTQIERPYICDQGDISTIVSAVKIIGSQYRGETTVQLLNGSQQMWKGYAIQLEQELKNAGIPLRR